MIVFTATNQRTHDVFVGKAQDSVDEEWAQMLEQAEAGAEGRFFDLLRENPTDFEVETWAYAETPAEARESFREAREDLDAEVIKVPRSRPSNSNAQPIRNASMKALLDSIREAGDEYDASEDEESLALGEGEPGGAVDAETNDATEAKPAVVASVDDAERLQARIDALKAAQAKVVRNKEAEAALRQPGSAIKKAKAKAKLATKVVAKAKVVEAAPTKLASGRTGSAVKEQRIKAAIEEDRESRDNFRAKSNHDQQAEMNALMARVEMRRTAQKVKKQEEAKKRAAVAAKEKKAAEKAVLTAKKEAEKLRKQTETLSSGKVELTQMQAEALVAKSRAMDAAEKAATESAAEPDAPAEKTKEERVREGMAQQRAQHTQQRRAQANQEADEMSNLLSRLDPKSRVSGERRRRG